MLTSYVSRRNRDVNETSTEVRKLQAQLLTRSIRAAAVMGIVVLACSIVRTRSVGWHNIMYFHACLYLVILGTALLDRRLSFGVKAHVALGVSFLMGAISLVFWGFGAFSLPLLFFFCMIATILFGHRGGCIACLLSALAIAVVGACVYCGILAYSFDGRVHLNSPITWLVVLLESLMLAGILVVILATLKRQLDGLVGTLQDRNRELVKKNMELEREIVRRIRSEEARQEMAVKLQAAEKMEMLGKLAGTVAHDLNNVLCSVVGYADMLLEGSAGESALRGDLETIRKSGIRAAAIVGDMLAIARRNNPITDVVNLNPIVEEYLKGPELETLRRYHPRIEVEIQCDPCLMNIRGTKHQLYKTLMNLVSNAAEAMPDGGKIVIGTEMCELVQPRPGYEVIPEGNYAVLRVSDCGTGIPAGDLPRIFEPFYTKKKMGRSGTGLGLSVVCGAVRDHGGYIDVASVEGGGTVFALYFPSTTEASGGAEPSFLRTDLKGRGETILVVGDAPEQREMVSRILGELGYMVRAVASGEEAVEFLKESAVDLVLLDMTMGPGMDGPETYKKVAETHPGQKAIVVTGNGATECVKSALSTGIAGFLKKPYLVNDLARAVRSALDGAQPRICRY